ncbi:MAG: hypothetical protein ABFC80_08750 [Coriobacteriales bacterium]
MLQTIPTTHEHLGTIVPRPEGVVGGFEHVREWLLERVGDPSFTVIDEGLPVAVLGIHATGPRRARVWAAVRPDARRYIHLVGEVRMLLTALDQTGLFDALDATVGTGDATAARFAEHFGFCRVGVATESLDLYERTAP